MVEGNGAIDLRRFEEFQEQRFSQLEQILRDGFDRIAEELKLTREQGHIPLSVMERVDRIYGRIFRSLCIVVALVVVWFTGLKYLAPHVFGN